MTVHRPTARTSVRTTGIPMYNNSINRYGNPNATQGFIWEEISWSTRLLERKKQQQSRVFYGVIFYVYTNADNKGDEFRRKKNMEIQSGGEKMRNARDQQGENERSEK